MLIDVVYHAVTDWQSLEGNPAQWVDDDHRALCNRLGFENGEEELIDFFESDWFSRICGEFHDLDAEKILSGIQVLEK